MEPQTEPRRRRRPALIQEEPVIISPEADPVPEQPKEEPVNKEPVITNAYQAERAIQSQTYDKKIKRKKKKAKRPVLLLLSSLYSLFCSLYILVSSVEKNELPETLLMLQWVFCLLAFILGILGFVFNAQTLALIYAATSLVSIILYSQSAILIIPAVIMGFAAYAIMKIEADKIEKERQREQEEEDRKNFMFRQGDHIMSMPPQAMQQAQAYGAQPIIINVQNSNTNTINGNDEKYDYKSKAKTFIIALLFGFLGFHRFYVGKNLTGILYFLTGGLLGIGWIVDCVLILTGAFRDSEGKPLK